MIIIYSLLLILIVVGSLAIVYIVLYNNMQHYTTKVDQAESIIDETLRKRYDLIISASKIIDKVVTDKKNLFKEFTKLKKENISNFDLDRKITENMILIKQLRADYSELQEHKEFKAIFNDLKATEEKLQAAKAYYNKNTNLLNDLIRKFPANLIAKMHDIKVRLFFDGKDMHDDVVDDFKF